MTVIVNGRPRELPAGATVDQVVAALTSADRGVAVAVNGTVVPRSDWAITTLGDQDAVEVITAVQGG
jgi:sulfur carrier protein